MYLRTVCLRINLRLNNIFYYCLNFAFLSLLIIESSNHKSVSDHLWYCAFINLIEYKNLNCSVLELLLVQVNKENLIEFPFDCYTLLIYILYLLLSIKSCISLLSHSCYESPKQEKVSPTFEHLIQNLKAYNGVRI